MLNTIKKIWLNLRGKGGTFSVADNGDSISFVDNENPENPFTNHTMVFPRGRGNAGRDSTGT